MQKCQWFKLRIGLLFELLFGIACVEQAREMCGAELHGTIQMKHGARARLCVCVCVCVCLNSHRCMCVSFGSCAVCNGACAADCDDKDED